MITGINIVRNCIVTGYPFIEAVLSALPLCDRYYINDGGSTDGTLEALVRLEKKYDKITVFNIADTPSIRWDCVSNQINYMMSKTDNEWIFLGNADELLHECDILPLRSLILKNKYRILRFDRREIVGNWSQLSQDIYHPTRVARNIKQVRQDWNTYGGDEFLYEDGWYDPDRLIRSGYIIYHLYNMFPENHLNKLKNDALRLSPGDKQRVKIYEIGAKSKYSPPTSVYKDLPFLARGLVGMKKYEVRECLFDKDWLKIATGLNY